MLKVGIPWLGGTGARLIIDGDEEVFIKSLQENRRCLLAQIGYFWYFYLG